MKEYVNKIELCGTVGQVSANRFSLCVVETYDMTIRNDWFDIVTSKNYDIKAGDFVRVVGSVRMKHYIGPNGNSSYLYQVAANDVQKLESEVLQ